MAIWGPSFLLRPLSLVLLAIIVATIALSDARKARRRCRMKVNGRIVPSLTMVCCLPLVAQAFFFRHEAAVMPLLVVCPGLVLSLAQFAVEMKAPGPEGEAILFSRKAHHAVDCGSLWASSPSIVLGAPVPARRYLLFVSGERWPIAAMGGALCLP